MKPAPPAGKRRLDLVPIDELVAAIRNPRTHDLDGIASSFLRFGYADTVLLDERTGRTVSGHGRVEALQLLRDKGADAPEGIAVAKDGSWSLPVNRGWSSVDDAAAEAYLLAANRWQEKGGYDHELLADMIRDLQEYDDELLLAAGFDELDQRDLLEAYGSERGRPGPPDDFPSLGGGIDAAYRCPSCGHEWNGDPAP